MNTIRTLATLAPFALGSSLLAADWPMWGGAPSRNMSTTETGINLDIDAGKKIKGKDDIDFATTKGCRWVVKLGSESYGTPVISQGRVLVGTNNEHPFSDVYKGDRSVLLCLDEKNGAMQWQLANPKLGTGKVSDWEFLGMCNTGAVEGNRIYMVTNRCSVVCLDLNGLKDGNQGPFMDEVKYLADKDSPMKELASTDADIIWTFDMREECGVFPHNVTSSSVLVVGDKVFANTSNGQDWTHTNIPAPKAPNLVCLSKKTGELLAEEHSGISKRCLHGSWSSPALANINGEDQVVIGSSDGYTYGFSTKTEGLKTNEDGIPVLEELWRHDGNAPEYRVDENGVKRPYQDFNGPSEIISTPTVYKGKVYSVIGQDPEHQEGVGMLSCIDPAKRGDQSGKEVWVYKDIRRSISTMAIVDDIIYAADFSGRLHAVDANTGKPYWVHDTKGRIWASPLVVDGNVIIPNEEGEIHVLKLGKEKALVKVINFPAQIYSTPVVANKTLYILTHTHLYAFGPKL